MQLSLFINGRPLDQMGEMVNYQGLVPVREVAEAVGAGVYWNGPSRTITVKRGDSTARFQIGNKTAVINGRTVELDLEPVLSSGKALVSLPVLASFLSLSPQFTVDLRTQVLFGKRIVLDPGHGGQYSGAVGTNGLLEKYVALNLALRLSRLLVDSGAQVKLTRTADKHVSLGERVEIAHAFAAEAFISIHLNAHSDRRVMGTETFYHPENKGALLLAKAVHPLLFRAVGTRDRGIKTAEFYVIRKSKMPSILVEVLFLTNPVEAQMITREDVRNRVVKAIYDGITQYFNSI